MISSNRANDWRGIIKHEVTRKQHNSRHCFVCGLENSLGLKAAFYETGSGELVAIIKPGAEHQSYPGRMHGGVAAAILDETIGRAVAIGKDDQVWGVTIELTMKYRKPVPLDQELMAVGRVSKDGGRIFEGSGEILLANGDVAVTAVGRYMKVPVEKITDVDFAAEDWFLAESPDDPKQVELPDKAT